MSPKVSIITATYNSEKFIYELIESVFGQSYQNWEWIITDDCSSDGTFEILKSLQEKDCRIKVFQNTINSGAAVSRNNSLKHALGDFVAFVDSDDVWMSNKLSMQLDFMLENKVDFSFTAYSIIDEDGKDKNIYIDKDNRKKIFNYNDMLNKRATLGCSTVILKNKIISDFNMPLLRTGQDYAFWLKVLKSNHKAVLLPIPLTKYRIVSNSISRNKFKKAKRQWEIYRKVERLSLSQSALCFLNYAYRAVFRG